MGKRGSGTRPRSMCTHGHDTAQRACAASQAAPGRRGSRRSDQAARARRARARWPVRSHPRGGGGGVIESWAKRSAQSMPAGWQARHLLGWLCGKPQRDTWAWEQGWCAARVRDARFPWHKSGQGGTPVQQRVRCATRSSRGTTACNHAALESRVGRHSPRHSCTRVQGCAAGRSRHTCWWGRGTASPRRRAAVWRCQQSARGVTRGFHACVRRGHAHVGGSARAQDGACAFAGGGRAGARLRARA